MGQALGEHFKQYQAIVLLALDNLEDLDGWENDFVMQLADRMGTHAERTFVSDKQRERLDRILDKLSGDGS